MRGVQDPVVCDRECDYCNSGTCAAGSYLSGKQSCGTCQTCNGASASCVGIDGAQDPGVCATACYYCSSGTCTFATSGSVYGCNSPSYCNNGGSCVTQIPNGGTGCTTGTQCLSGFCDTGNGMCCTPGDVNKCCASSDSECGTGNHCMNNASHGCTLGSWGSPCETTADCDAFSCGTSGIRKCWRSDFSGVCISPYLDCSCDCNY